MKLCFITTFACVRKQLYFEGLSTLLSSHVPLGQRSVSTGEDGSRFAELNNDSVRKTSRLAGKRSTLRAYLPLCVSAAGVGDCRSHDL